MTPTPNDLIKWVWGHKYVLDELRVHRHIGRWSVSILYRKPGSKEQYSVARFGKTLEDACRNMGEALNEKEAA